MLDDVVLGLTTSGVVKVWTIGAQDLNNLSEPLLEHESKQIRCLNATSMTCCLYNQRTVIIVTPRKWEVQQLQGFLITAIGFIFVGLFRFMMLGIFRYYAPFCLDQVNRGSGEIF